MNTATPRDFMSAVDARLLEATTPSSDYFDIPESEPLLLDSNQLLGPVRVAYQTYGTLNAAKSNAILVCHALTGDQYVASQHPVTRKPGSWETMVGPGKPIDTDRFFVVCPNILGGCMGTTGPASINPKTGKVAIGLVGSRTDSRTRMARRGCNGSAQRQSRRFQKARIHRRFAAADLTDHLENAIFLL